MSILIYYLTHSLITTCHTALIINIIFTIFNALTTRSLLLIHYKKSLTLTIKTAARILRAVTLWVLVAVVFIS